LKKENAQGEGIAFLGNTLGLFPGEAKSFLEITLYSVP
jgi:hypothetical protein